MKNDRSIRTAAKATGLIAALIIVAILSGVTAVAAENEKTYQLIEDAIVT
jgi:hypothetical protein